MHQIALVDMLVLYQHVLYQLMVSTFYIEEMVRYRLLEVLRLLNVTILQGH